MALGIGIGLGLIPTAARPAATTAPVNVVKPFFEGPLTQGQSAAVNPGSWTGLPSPNFVYAIKRGATTVSTDPAYVWTAADVAAGAGAMTVAVTATNNIGPATATSDPVTIAAPLQISGTPASAMVGSAYSFIPTRSGGHGPYAFELTGTLPAGLSFSTETGEISGSPLASGTAVLSIQVTDADDLSASLGPFDLTVTAAGYDYLASNWTDLVAAISTYGTDGNATIGLLSDGDYGVGQTITAAPAARLTIKGLVEDARSKLPTLTIGPGSKNLRFENIDFGDGSDSVNDCLRLSSSGATPQNIELDNCDFYGPSYDAYGNYQTVVPHTRSGVSGAFNNLTVTNCFFFALSSAVKLSSQEGNLTVRGNLSDLLYIDFVSVGTTSLSNRYVVKDNFLTRIAGKGTDDANPHCDFVQFTMTSGGISKSRFIVEGNVKYQGESRGAGQNLLASSAVTSRYDELRCTDNLWVMNDPTGVGMSVGEGHSPEISYTSASYVARNRVLRANPGSGTGTNVSKVTTGADRLPSILCDSVGENFASVGGVSANNIILPNTLSAYQAAFENNGSGVFTSLPANRYGSRGNVAALKAWVVSTFRPKATGVLSHLRDVYDYATGALVDPSAERTFLPLKSVYERPASTVYETAWLPVIGGASGQVIVPVAGTRWKKATDSSGTGATSYSSSPGTVNPWDYIKLDVTSGAAGSGPKAFGCTINGYVYSKVIVPVSVSDFTPIDNQATAWSQIVPNLPSEASQRKAIVAFRYKRDVTTNSLAMLGSASGNTLRQTTSSAKEIFTFRSPASLSVTSPFNADTNWHTDIWVIDFTKTTADEVLAWIRDYERIIGYTGMIDANTENGVNIQGSLTFNPASNFPIPQLFAISSTNIGDGQEAFLWMHWGDSSYTLPDASDAAAFCNKFTPDNINLTDGSGPLGFSPKLFFHGTPAEWNDAGGIANKGSLTATYKMVKQAGTYAAG